MDSFDQQRSDTTDEPAGMPGVPESAQAAAGPTQATSSGSGPAPAAGQDETRAAPTDGVAPSEEVAEASGRPDSTDEPDERGERGERGEPGEPGANGAFSTAADPLAEQAEQAEDLGLEPGASDAYDAGQDNGLNS
jgi:hypothetical protein